jgi:hypothetical protein
LTTTITTKPLIPNKLG